MKKLRKLTTSDLLLARQWLQFQSDSTVITADYAREARRVMNDVDKLLWARLISSETPCGVCIEPMAEFEDSNFKETLKEIRGTSNDE